MKNRLTNRAKSGFVYCTQCCINPDKDCVEQDCFKAILDRLAAYEDSGLSPEEVVEIKKYLNMWIEICKENNVSIVQFKKWAEAEQDGRVKE